MKNVLTIALLISTNMVGNAQLNHGYPIDPVSFTSVTVTDSFWGQRLKASREVTIPLAFSKCEETGRYENFVKAAHPSDTYKVDSPLTTRMSTKPSREPVTRCRLTRTRNCKSTLTAYL